VLRVVCQSGAEVYFKTKRETPLRKLMAAFCQRENLSQGSVRFLWDGKRLQEDDTPGALGMKEQDMIDAVPAQTGGTPAM
jgi:small ubiquitin-related modifier